MALIEMDDCLTMGSVCRGLRKLGYQSVSAKVSRLAFRLGIPVRPLAEDAVLRRATR